MKVTYRLQIASNCEEIHPILGPRRPHGNATLIGETLQATLIEGVGWEIRGDDARNVAADSLGESLNVTVLRYIAQRMGFDLREAADKEGD